MLEKVEKYKIGDKLKCQGEDIICEIASIEKWGFVPIYMLKDEDGVLFSVTGRNMLDKKFEKI